MGVVAGVNVQCIEHGCIQAQSLSMSTRRPSRAQSVPPARLKNMHTQVRWQSHLKSLSTDTPMLSRIRKAWPQDIHRSHH